MPKTPSEPLYNHKARPTFARQISVSVAGTTGRRNVSITSNLVPTISLPSPPPRNEEWYPMPMEVDMDVDDNGDVGNRSTNSQPEAVEALPGINVVPKQKAKRYENSVSL
jgi:hypothetical protein